MPSRLGPMAAVRATPPARFSLLAHHLPLLAVTAVAAGLLGVLVHPAAAVGLATASVLAVLVLRAAAVDDPGRNALRVRNRFGSHEVDLSDRASALELAPLDEAKGGPLVVAVAGAGPQRKVVKVEASALARRASRERQASFWVGLGLDERLAKAYVDQLPPSR